jgi:serpin B
MANALWAQRGSKLREEYLSQLKTNYGAGVELLDFKTATEASRQTINAWVAKKTEDKITNLIGPGVLTPKTRLVLTNAIYFNGAWETQFDAAKTKVEDFHQMAGKTVQAPLMHRDGKFGYFDGGTFQELEIPYKSNELSLILLLPRDVSGLPALESALTPANAKEWMGKLEPVKKVIVTMPKFKMTQEFELKDVLSAMGMPLAFQSGSADFSGMTDEKPGFVISAVIHKAFVDVNEQGTEAAAATAVVMFGAMAAMRPPAPPPVFRADHPFVFLIRDNATGAILFMGRVESPQ